MDNLNKKDRHKCMSHIRSKNTGLEQTIFKQLNKRRIKYKKHYNIIGKPDIAFPEKRVAIFLDSDFWHGWQFSRWKNRLPKKYWQKKIETNIKRDKRKIKALRRQNWRVIRIWEHQIKENPKDCLLKIIRLLGRNK